MPPLPSLGMPLPLSSASLERLLALLHSLKLFSSFNTQLEPTSWNPYHLSLHLYILDTLAPLLTLVASPLIQRCHIKGVWQCWQPGILHLEGCSPASAPATPAGQSPAQAPLGLLETRLNGPQDDRMMPTGA